MNLFNRTTARRIIAVTLALLVILSGVSCFAASYRKSAAGIKYGGKTFKLGATTTLSALKKVFGSSCTTGNVAVCDNLPNGGRLYKFSKKGVSIETRYTNARKTSEQIITITVTGKNIPTIAGLKIGDSTSVIKDKYGTKCAKDRYDSNHVWYSSGSLKYPASNDYIMDIYTTSTKNSRGKTVRKVRKIEFLIN